MRRQPAVRLTAVRRLDLIEPSRPGRGAFVTAASGLVRVGNGFYVVADDELHLGVFRGPGPGRLLRLFEGRLPLKPRKRKRKKPDLESLVRLPGRSLLALPSGSRERRRTGARIALGPDHADTGRVVAIDVGPLYAALREEFEDLNIEGAAVTRAHLVLLQRGNGASRQNAAIFLDRRAALSQLARARTITGREIDRIARVDLGEIDGVPLGFTDACALPGGEIAFVAAAEDGDSTYEDGTCAGSIVGVISRSGAVGRVRSIQGPSGRRVKAEGLWVAGRRAWVVTDADDPGVPSVLYEGRL